MKKFLLFLLILALVGCANKKKKALLFPFFAILDETPSGQVVVSNPTGSEMGTGLNAPPAPTTLTSSTSETYQVQPLQSNNYVVSPSSFESTTSFSDNSSEVISTTESKEDSTLSKDASTTEESSSTPTTNVATPTLSEQRLSASVEVATQKEPFKFETTRSYKVNSVIVDANQTPVPNALVGFYEVDPKNGESKLIFQQVSNSDGRIQGTLLVNQSVEQVEAIVSIGNETSKPLPIPLLVAVTRADGSVVNMPVATISQITIPIIVKSHSQLADRDGDGVLDVNDFYPDDPTKATRLRFPHEGVYTIAYEDLFPSAGDADLNDYVIQMFNEEDLDAQGRIVEIRGTYQHVARGAGYKHTLNLKLPKNAFLTFESVIYDANGNDTRTGKVRYTPSREELEDGIEILGDSSKTINSSNVDPSKPFRPGHKAVVKIQFDKPVSREELGNAPYDLFIRILSKKIDKNYPASAPRASNPALQYYEVHFPNLYFDSKGKDVYLDSKGFPWAILIPKVWAWPLEGSTYDIRGTKSAYPKFKIWMESKGELEKDWYFYPDKNYAYPLPETSSLTAFLNNIPVNFSLAVGVAIVIVTFLYLRKRASFSN